MEIGLIKPSFYRLRKSLTQYEKGFHILHDRTKPSNRKKKNEYKIFSLENDILPEQFFFSSNEGIINFIVLISFYNSIIFNTF